METEGKKLVAVEKWMPSNEDAEDMKNRSNKK